MMRVILRHYRTEVSRIFRRVIKANILNRSRSEKILRASAMVDDGRLFIHKVRLHEVGLMLWGRSVF